LGDCYVGTGHKGKATDPKNPNGRNGQTIALNHRVEGLKPKDLVGIPWRVAFALQADGWYLRQDIIWNKPNAMPEPVRDRPTKSHEYLFLLSKSSKYFFDADAIAEKASGQSSGNGFDRPQRLTIGKGSNQPYKGSPTRKRRSVWDIPTRPFGAAHFAVMPEELVTPCVLAGAPEGGLVLDPFMGSGTTLSVARRLGRRSVGFEINAEFIEIAMQHRLNQGVLS
jgi:hypothetical protein